MNPFQTLFFCLSLLSVHSNVLFAAEITCPEGKRAVPNFKDGKPVGTVCVEQGPRPKLVKVEWDMKGDSTAFTKKVGMRCLSSPISRMAPSKNHIVAIDAPECVAELQKLTEAWDSSKNGDLLGVFTAGRNKSEIQKQVKSKFGGDVSFVGEIKGCPCVVLHGSKSQEASPFIQSLK